MPIYVQLGDKSWRVIQSVVVGFLNILNSISVGSWR